jgi:F0F1-type ATP synthase epsilon subunit
MSSKDSNTHLSVVARGPFEIYYEGEAESVSAANQVGPFDILPGHSAFFSILSPCEVTIISTKESEPINFEINNGIATAKNDEVMLFVNI